MKSEIWNDPFVRPIAREIRPGSSVKHRVWRFVLTHWWLGDSYASYRFVFVRRGNGFCWFGRAITKATRTPNQHRHNDTHNQKRSSNATYNEPNQCRIIACAVRCGGNRRIARRRQGIVAHRRRRHGRFQAHRCRQSRTFQVVACLRHRSCRGLLHHDHSRVAIATIANAHWRYTGTCANLIENVSRGGSDQIVGRTKQFWSMRSCNRLWKSAISNNNKYVET